MTASQEDPPGTVYSASEETVQSCQKVREANKAVRARRSLESGFTLSVKDLNGETLPLNVTPEMTIGEVKELLKEFVGDIPLVLRKLQLRYEKKILESKFTVAHYSLQKESTVYTVLPGDGTPLSKFMCLMEMGAKEARSYIQARSWLSIGEAITVNQFPVQKPLPNFVKLRAEWRRDNADLPTTFLGIQKIVHRYTDDAYEWLNLALAADVCHLLKKESGFIRKLCHIINVFPGYTGRVYRGLHMAQVEAKAMQDMKKFYIPGFTSTSKTKNACFYKNTILKIDVPAGTRVALDIDRAEEYAGVPFSRYGNEREVLLQPYCKFKWISTKMSARQRKIRLRLLDTSSDVLKLHEDPSYESFQSHFAFLHGNASKVQAMAMCIKPTSSRKVITVKRKT